MEELLIKLRLLLRAEIILLRIQLRRAVLQAAFYLAAVLLVVLAVGMLNVALYLYLAPRFDNAGAALAVAVVDIVLAALAVIVAGQLHLGPEVAAVETVREDVMAQLAVDAEKVKIQIAELHDDIKRIRTAVTGFFSFDSVNLASLVQWVPAIIRLLLRRKGP